MRLFDIEMDPRPRLDGWCPGKYLGPCFTCDERFIGDKRSHTCADCAYNDYDLLDKHLTDGNKKVYYPISKIEGFRRTGAPLLDFINRFKSNNPDREVKYYRQGYWIIN